MKERMKAHGAWLSGAPRRDVLRTRSDGRRLRGRAHMQQTGGCLDSLNDQRAAVTLTVARLRSTPGKRWRRLGRPVGLVDVVCMSNSTRVQRCSGGVGVPRVDDRYFGSVKASTAAAGNPRMTRQAFGPENSCRRTATTVPWIGGGLGGSR